MAETELEKGEAFLKENAKKEGVKTTASGLQYKVLKEGSGKSPKATDTVQVHYRGTLSMARSSIVPTNAVNRSSFRSME